jgi:hypothetical protein
MTDTMTQCVPVATGALTPDQRVNYLFGLVLGVDEFQQEDLYFRERDERATRTLHGYGTNVGLDVTAERPDAAPDDVEVKVARGVLYDQYGRPVVIPTDQCARVGAWIAAEEEAAAAEEAASPLQEHLGPSGDVTLYVVAEYHECPDGLVPLPGAPCGSDDEVTAPSRLRDSWKLGFRWEPPSMSHWDGVRALADILIHVDLDDLSPIESDEELLAQHIRALVPGTEPPATPLPPRPLLPRLEARAALDRLLTIWVTEVRPTLAPDLIHPEGDPAVLLSSITVVPANPFDTEAPEILDFQKPDDEGRPYLAPTQLIQELVLMGGGTTNVVSGSPPEPGEAQPLIELAMLDERIQPEAGRRLYLWPTIEQRLLVPSLVQVSRDDGPFETVSAIYDEGLNAYILSPPYEPFSDGEHIEVQLDLNELQVRIGEPDPQEDIPLLDWLDDQGVGVVGAWPDETLPLHHIMRPRASTPDPEPPRPVRELATAGPSVDIEGQTIGVEVWWHVDKDPQADDERVSELNADNTRVLAEAENQGTPVPIAFEVERRRHNVDTLVLSREDWEKTEFSPYLRVLVAIENITLSEFGGNLVEYADALGIQWEDAQVDNRVLVLYVRIPGRDGGVR